jgi:hypothetical protein
MVPDEVYFAQRARGEEQAAAEAVCVEAKAAHLELAARYQALADALRDEHRRMSIGTSDPEPTSAGF